MLAVDLLLRSCVVRIKLVCMCESASNLMLFVSIAGESPSEHLDAVKLGQSCGTQREREGITRSRWLKPKQNRPLLPKFLTPYLGTTYSMPVDTGELV